MDGGTFTISNGGVFGSLMGTPIINPPQSAILGLHAINNRPVAINGQVRHSFFISFAEVFLEVLALVYSWSIGKTPLHFSSMIPFLNFDF